MKAVQIKGVNTMIVFIFGIVFLSISGCAETINTLHVKNRTDTAAYDNTVCESGEPSLPGQPRRYGYVNDKSRLENQADFLKYKKDRALYLQENK